MHKFMRIIFLVLFVASFGFAASAQDGGGGHFDRDQLRWRPDKYESAYFQQHG